ncbi:MAG: hypothetical protein KDK66_08160 [Deltaproteobacteria bacterium]|nr:hypothetical protein [Deltaproteobacteria bacterium]
MLKFLSFCLGVGLSLLSYQHPAQAESSTQQQSPNTLCGTYLLQGEDGLVKKLIFDGSSKVTVITSLTENKRPFWIEKDLITIKPDKSLFKLRMKDKKLVGEDYWLKDKVYRKDSKTSQDCP